MPGRRLRLCSHQLCGLPPPIIQDHTTSHSTMVPAPLSITRRHTMLCLPQHHPPPEAAHLLLVTTRGRRLSRPANGDGREVARALPNVPVHDCPCVGWDEHLAAPNNPNRGRTWPLRVSPGPIKFAHCRESLGTRPSNCPVVRGVRGHNWLLSASGVLGHLLIPICYPDARRGPDGKPADL